MPQVAKLGQLNDATISGERNEPQSEGVQEVNSVSDMPQVAKLVAHLRREAIRSSLTTGFLR